MVEKVKFTHLSLRKTFKTIKYQGKKQTEVIKKHD